MAGTNNQKATKSCLLIYDGNCRMCVAAKEGLERIGREEGLQKIRMITYQSPEAAEVLGSTYRPGRPDAAFLVRPNGEIAQGLDAFFPLLPGLRGGWLLQALFRLPLMKPLCYVLYRMLARYRYQLFGAVTPVPAHKSDENTKQGTLPDDPI